MEIWSTIWKMMRNMEIKWTKWLEEQQGLLLEQDNFQRRRRRKRRRRRSLKSSKIQVFESIC
jgi:hypothetical protein